MSHTSSLQNSNDKSLRLPEYISQLKESLDASCSYNSGMYSLEVDSKLGSGEVKVIDFKNGMTLTVFDMLLFKDVTFNLNPNITNSLFLLYGLEGICYHNFKGMEKFTRIEELRSYILGTSTNSSSSEIAIKKDSKFVFSVINIDKNKYLDNFIELCNIPVNKTNKLSEAFKKLNDYVYCCSHNLKIAKQLRQLKNTCVPFDMTYLFQLEGYSKIIFALHVEQFYKEIYEERITTSLTRTELQKIRLVTEYIVDNPMIDHRIKKLCYRATISPVKLQEGFKCLHDTTVSNFIRNIRIEKARDLIINSDYNISEIAYMVGFTSRSYFCKIFKENFGYNATAYRDKFKEKAIDIKSL